MTKRRQLRLGAFMRPVSIHTAAWRYPGAYPDANFNLAHMKRFIQTLERGRFDGIFIADVLGVYDVYRGNLDTALRVSAQIPVNEPMLLVPAVSPVCTVVPRPASRACWYMS